MYAVRRVYENCAGIGRRKRAKCTIFVRIYFSKAEIYVRFRFRKGFLLLKILGQIYVLFKRLPSEEKNGVLARGYVLI